MRLCSLFVVTFALLSHYATCSMAGGKTAATGAASRAPVVVRLKPVNAHIKEVSGRAAHVTTSKIGVMDKIEVGRFSFAAELKGAQFVDESNGWAASGQAVYKTTDGGKTWVRLAPTLPSDSHITSFFFTSPARGWLVVVTRTDNERYGAGTASHVSATADGGATWTQQASFPDGVDIRRIIFLNASEGLVVGTRVIDQRPPYNEAFVARTGDGGRTWGDLSEKLRPILQSDAVQDINCPSPSRMLLLTDGGSIVSSADRGQNWVHLVKFNDERPNGVVSSTGYYRLALDTRERIRVIAGAEGDEGYWGDLITTHEGDTWNSYELIRTPLRDAIFLSETEVLACGRQLHPYDENTQTSRRSSGVILHSLDGGMNWSILHISGADETFIYLTKVSDGQFYAVSDAGTFLRFTLQSQ